MIQLDDLLDKPAPWLKALDEDADIIMSSRIRLARNLADFPFISQMTPLQAKEVECLLHEKLSKILSSAEYGYYKLEDLSSVDLYFLYERHLISKEHIHGKNARAVAFNPEETWSIMINEEDHLRLQMICSQLNLASLWESMTQLDDNLEELLCFAFDEAFGYLTACPTNAGTGLRASVMLHLPGIQMTGQIDKICHAAAKVNLVVRGFYGEGTAALGDFFQISNQVTLGKSEKELVRTIEKVVPQILQHERSVRATMLNRNSDKLRDRFEQAMEKLENSQQLSSEEAMNHLSMLRLGVSMNVIEKLSLYQVNQLFLLSQPSHLQKKYQQSLNSKQRDTIRAQFFRNFFAKL